MPLFHWKDSRLKEGSTVCVKWAMCVFMRVLHVTDIVGRYCKMILVCISALILENQHLQHVSEQPPLYLPASVQDKIAVMINPAAAGHPTVKGLLQNAADHFCMFIKGVEHAMWMLLSMVSPIKT